MLYPANKSNPNLICRCWQIKVGHIYVGQMTSNLKSKVNKEHCASLAMCWCVCLHVLWHSDLLWALWLSQAPHPVAVVPNLSLGNDKMIFLKESAVIPLLSLINTCTHAHIYSTSSASTSSVASCCMRTTRLDLPQNTNKTSWCGARGTSEQQREGETKTRGNTKDRIKWAEPLPRGEKYKTNQPKLCEGLNYKPESDKNKQNETEHNEARPPTQPQSKKAHPPRFPQNNQHI